MRTEVKPALIFGSPEVEGLRIPPRPRERTLSRSDKNFPDSNKVRSRRVSDNNKSRSLTTDSTAAGGAIPPRPPAEPAHQGTSGPRQPRFSAAAGRLKDEVCSEVIGEKN